jgi:hypothetical protein
MATEFALRLFSVLKWEVLMLMRGCYVSSKDLIISEAILQLGDVAGCRPRRLKQMAMTPFN